MAIESVRHDIIPTSHITVASRQSPASAAPNQVSTLQVERTAPGARKISKFAYGASIVTGALAGIAVMEGSLIGGLLPGVKRDTRACALQICVPTNNSGVPTDSANTGWGPSQAGGLNYASFKACLAAFSPTQVLFSPGNWQDPVDLDGCFSSSYDRLVTMTVAGLVGGIVVGAAGAWMGAKLARRFGAKSVAEDGAQSV